MGIKISAGALLIILILVVLHLYGWNVATHEEKRQVVCDINEQTALVSFAKTQELSVKWADRYYLDFQDIGVASDGFPPSSRAWLWNNTTILLSSGHGGPGFIHLELESKNTHSDSLDVGDVSKECWAKVKKFLESYIDRNGKKTYIFEKENRELH